MNGLSFRRARRMCFFTLSLEGNLCHHCHLFLILSMLVNFIIPCMVLTKHHILGLKNYLTRIMQLVSFIIIISCLSTFPHMVSLFFYLMWTMWSPLAMISHIESIMHFFSQLLWDEGFQPFSMIMWSPLAMLSHIKSIMHCFSQLLWDEVMWTWFGS